MSTARYLVAKYVPDLWRIEPRNIGVIVWTPDGAVARFIGEQSGRLGSPDRRKIPREVHSPNAYIQWVQYWRSVIDQQEFQPVAGGTPIPRTSPRFVEALKESGQGNYVLSEGGALLDAISDDGLPSLADYLFHMLVEPREVAEEGYDSVLEEKCEDLIREARLDTNPHFRRRLSLPCRLPEWPVDDPLTFSYGYGNGALQRIYQRVELPRQEEAVSRNVHSAAWMFETAIRAQQIRPEQGTVLVYLPGPRRTDAIVVKWLRVLRATVPNVLDVADASSALRDFQELAEQGEH